MGGKEFGEDAGIQNEPLPRDGYYFYENRELFGLINYVYFGFFQNKVFEIIELGFNDSDITTRQLRRISQKKYSIEYSDGQPVFHLRQMGESLSASSAIDLNALCPFELESVQGGSPVAFKIRNLTDSSFEVYAGNERGWVVKKKATLEYGLESCLRRP
ncbi:MAG: hypothetical protein JWP91_3332 [Fibrobacteres bacterium]|nr:hypothetical protein [Fibrobacterota bacterium]